jgi:two-component system response regulator AtoC
VTDNPAELVSMEELERRYIVRVLEAVGGNKTAAARVLGFERKTLYRKLEHFGIDDSVRHLASVPSPSKRRV